MGGHLPAVRRLGGWSGGGLIQHFNGSVTDYQQDGNTAYICGEVKVLQLGSNTNEGLFFEIVVEDNGVGGDKLNWYRQAGPTDCTNGSPAAGHALTSGNLIVR